MKKTKKIIFGVIAILILILGVLWIAFNVLFRESADWKFIQSVGGIRTEMPLETEDGFYLPVICDVSGYDSVTIKPTIINSAISCLKVKVKIDKNKIYLKVVTGIAISKNDDCICKAVNIGHLEFGTYEVYYVDKSTSEHKIGQFTIENKFEKYKNVNASR
jgi:hypothetical protein